MGLANQSRTPGRTTLLEAVGILLENIGEQPVDSLENEQIQDARVAERTLLEFHKEGQTSGWSWNAEEAYPFTRDESTKEISVPSNVLRWTIDPYQWAGRFQLRGQRVYDRDNRTYKLDDDITELTADVVWMLPWDDCPEAYNRWVVIRSARVFSDRILSSDSIFKYTELDERAARAELQQMELQQGQYNYLTGGPNLRPFPTYSPGAGLVTRRIGAGHRI